MKSILVIVITFFTVSSYCQIGNSKELQKYYEVGGYGSNKLEYSIKDGIKNYILIYKNQEFAQISDMKSISFTATDEELEYLYQELKSMQSLESEKFLEIGNESIVVKPMSMKWINVYVNQASGLNGFFSLSPKQLDKLFGKR